MFYSMR